MPSWKVNLKTSIIDMFPVDSGNCELLPSDIYIYIDYILFSPRISAVDQCIHCC